MGQLAPLEQRVNLAATDAQESRRLVDREQGIHPDVVRMWALMGSHASTLPLTWTTLASAEKSALDLCRRVFEEERDGAIPSVAASEIDRASWDLFAFAQEALRWLPTNGYGALDERFLIELWRLQTVAFGAAALRCPGGRRRAKLLQIEAGLGAPLTVCVGELLPTRLPDLRDLLDPNGDLEEHIIPTIDWNTRGSGCGAIHPDSTALRRPSLTKWCAECRARTTSRRDARTTSIRKAFEGSPSALMWIDGRRVRVWTRTCTVCDMSFRTDKAHRYRCNTCHPDRSPSG